MNFSVGMMKGVQKPSRQVTNGDTAAQQAWWQRGGFMEANGGHGYD